MGTDLQWLLLALPVAFGLGWLASRIDLRQWRQSRRDAPRAYFDGLNLLLNEQQDKAIDAFIEAVQLDPDTTDLHFALGNLFRRRGEFERAVRVHQHLLARGDLRPGERDRAQHALAQDFMKAGLFDRAEAAWTALAGSAFDTESRLALLSLHERAHDWPRAIDVATRLEASGTGSFATRLAHYHCESALEADAAGHPDQADEAIERALRADPQAARPRLLAGERAARLGQWADALQAWGELCARRPEHFALVAEGYARAALQCGQVDAARATLSRAYAEDPRLEFLLALDLLDGRVDAARLLAHLQRSPTLSAAASVLAQPVPSWSAGTAEGLASAVQHAAEPLRRYRCAACGFEAQHYFWQCPGCQGWDTYPPRRLDSA